MDLQDFRGKKIGLIAFDLDGTVLRDDKTISARTEAAILEATNRGILVMSATGRPLNAIPNQFRELPGIRYLMSANGANIYDTWEKRTVYRANMTLEQVEHVVEFLDPLDVWWEVLIDGVSYVEQRKFDHMECYVRPESFDYIKETRRPVESLHAYYRSRPDELEKVCCFFREPSRLEYVELHFPKRADLCDQVSSEVNYEAADHNSTKGCALRHMAELMGIPIEQVMAFGDGLNDMDMIQAAGIGVAMGNAFPQLQAVADHVTLTNEEDGVAVVLETLLQE